MRGTKKVALIDCAILPVFLFLSTTSTTPPLGPAPLPTASDFWSFALANLYKAPTLCA